MLRGVANALALEAAIGSTGKDRLSRSQANPPTTRGDCR